MPRTLTHLVSILGFVGLCYETMHAPVMEPTLVLMYAAMVAFPRFLAHGDGGSLASSVVHALRSRYMAGEIDGFEFAEEAERVPLEEWS